MNRERLELWLADLEQPGLKQAQNRLRTSDDSYCCLGRLCEVARANGLDLGIEAVSSEEDGELACYEYDGNRHYAPAAVIDWLEAEQELDEFPRGDVIAIEFPEGKHAVDNGHDFVTGSRLNDIGCTFAQIVDCFRWNYGL